MFQLVRALRRQEIVLRQIPAVSAAFVIAGSFYTFHSFYLECAAFLATWYVIDAFFEVAGRLVRTTTARKTTERSGG